MVAVIIYFNFQDLVVLSTGHELTRVNATILHDTLRSLSSIYKYQHSIAGSGEEDLLSSQIVQELVEDSCAWVSLS